MAIPDLPIAAFEVGSVAPLQLAYIAQIAKPYPNYRRRMERSFHPFRRRQIAHNCKPAVDAFEDAPLSCRLGSAPKHTRHGAGDPLVALGGRDGDELEVASSLWIIDRRIDNSGMCS